MLYVNRPANARAEQTLGIFKLTADSDLAERVPVTWGSSSVDLIVINAGLEPGDQIILSDMSRFRAESQLRIVR